MPAAAVAEAVAADSGESWDGIDELLHASTRRRKMAIRKFHIKGPSLPGLSLVMIFAAVVLFASSLAGAVQGKARQKAFPSAEEAVNAMVTALKNNDGTELSLILGPQSESLISSGDETSDRAGRERFLKTFEEMNKLEQESPGKMILHIGNGDYPFPIPIVKTGEQWLFDTKAGKEEILNRRIGKNELSVIEVLHAYVDAQYEYASNDRNGDGVVEFAQKFASTKGRRDGLYWEVKEGEEESPFGPLVARAAQEGYAAKGKSGKPISYHGYFYRILKAQGKNAPGGQYDYVVKGKMILGFALVAYPAQYGASGIMTFMINQEGVIYEKDFGKDSAKIAAALKRYDPDTTWKRVEETTGKP
ncbi:MAG: DUF2950 domain-containing protein [bacterium]